MPDHTLSTSRPDSSARPESNSRPDSSARAESNLRPDSNLLTSSGFPATVDRPADRLDSRFELWVTGFLIRLDALRDRPWVGVGLALLCFGAVGSLWWIGRPTEPPAVELTIPMVGDEAPVSGGAGEATGGEVLDDTGDERTLSGPAATKAEQSVDAPGNTLPDQPTELVVVHVSGEVKRQGLVTLPPTARIADAVAAAGGPLESADTHQLNLAAKIADGQHIRVPAFGDDPSGPLVVGGVSGPGPAAKADGGAAVVININTAERAALESLPGIGPAIASAIVQWRDDNGRFETADDLLLVSGIGPAKLSTIRDLVTT